MGCAAAVGVSEEANATPERVARVVSIEDTGPVIIVKLSGETRTPFGCSAGQVAVINPAPGPNGAPAGKPKGFLGLMRPTADPVTGDRCPVLRCDESPCSFSCVIPCDAPVSQTLKTGNFVRVSGFEAGLDPIRQAQEANVVLVALGSVAMGHLYPALKEVMEVQAKQLDNRAPLPVHVTLVYGEGRREDLCFTDDLDNWEVDQGRLQAVLGLTVEYALRLPDEDWCGLVGPLSAGSISSVCNITQSDIVLVGAREEVAALGNDLSAAGAPRARICAHPV